MYLDLFPMNDNEYFVKGIKNGYPCIVEIRGTQGCALVGDVAKAQP